MEWIYSLTDWNITLFLLLLVSVVAIAIFIERLFFLSKAELNTQSFILELKRKLEEKDMIEAFSLCEQETTPLSRIIQAYITRYHLSKETIHAALETAGRLEIAKLESKVSVLSIFAHLSPLLGLLGTVLGFIRAFGEMRLRGMMDISADQIGAAMESCLVTTALGLTVAVPCILGYNYLVARIQRLLLEIDVATKEILETVEQSETLNV